MKDFATETDVLEARIGPYNNIVHSSYNTVYSSVMNNDSLNLSSVCGFVVKLK